MSYFESELLHLLQNCYTDIITLFFFCQVFDPKIILGCFGVIYFKFLSIRFYDCEVLFFVILLYSYTLSSVYIFLWICHNNRDFRLCSILRGINVCLSFGNPLDHSACTYCCYIRIGTRILWIISG